MFVPLVWFSALSFLGYGMLCLTTPYMVAEFERYGLPGARTLTGTLQILAAAGLLMGFAYPKLGALAAAGLTAQMLVGFAVRIRIDDTFFQSLPSIFFFLLNAVLAYWFLTRR